ncbi:MAG: sodium:solute symporter [Phycisphaerae bacterium]
MCRIRRYTFGVHIVLGSIGWLDWSVVGLYFLTVAAVGTWFARRQKSTEQYFVGGGRVPGWAAGLSLFASSISTATFLAYPGNGFGGDWTRQFPNFMLPVALILVSVAVIPFYRQVVRMSVYEYLEQRFGYPARAYAAGVYLLVNLFRMGLVLFLTGKALNAMTGWNTEAIILICGGITIAYTMFGGFEAVIWTDVMQCLILLTGGLLCAGVILASCDDGPWQALRVAYDANKFKLADVSLDLTQPTILVMALYGFFAPAGGYTTTQDTVQRYLAPSTTRAARRGLWLGCFSCMTTWMLFMFIGTMLWVYYRTHPGELPADIARDQDKVFPRFVMAHLPGGFVGLFVAAMLAAGMSTLSTQMNSLSMVSICDFWGRYRPTHADRHRLLLSKIATCLWGVGGTVSAISMIGVTKALDFSYVMYSLLAGGLFGIFMLAFLVRRAHAWGVYVGLLAGALVSLWGTVDELVKLGVPVPAFIRATPFPFHTLTVAAFSSFAAFTAGLLASLILPAGPGGSHGLTFWDRPSAQPHRQELLTAQR